VQIKIKAQATREFGSRLSVFLVLDVVGFRADGEVGGRVFDEVGLFPMLVRISARQA
jgi:hypothetical protein